MLTMCLVKHYVKKIYGEAGGIAAFSFSLALDGSEWSSSRPCHFISWKYAPIPLDRRLRGTHGGADAVKKRKVLHY
jgi:hypothetical protein